MWLLDKIKSLFDKSAQDKPGFIRDKETGVYVQTDDPMAAEVIAQAFTSGKPVIGTRDDSGKVTIKKLDR